MVDPKVLLGLISVALAMTLALARPPRLHYIDCQSDSDCGSPTTCCAISQQRFAIPQCAVLTGEGQPCRPDHAPLNKTLTYPDGSVVDFFNVWQDMCPCSFGLECSRWSGTCEQPRFTISNRVDDFVWDED